MTEKKQYNIIFNGPVGLIQTHDNAVVSITDITTLEKDYQESMNQIEHEGSLPGCWHKDILTYVNSLKARITELEEIDLI